MQDIITVLELVAGLAEKLGGTLTMCVLAGFIWFKYLRHGSVIVLGNGDKVKLNGQNGQNGQNGNGATKGPLSIFNQTLCDNREKNCLERFSYQKEKLDDHEKKLEKGAEEFKVFREKMGNMHGDIKLLLHDRNLKSLQDEV